MTKQLTLLLFFGLAWGQDSTLLISNYETYSLIEGDTLSTLPNIRNEFSYDINGNLIQNRKNYISYYDNAEHSTPIERIIYSYDNLNRNVDSTLQEANGFWDNQSRWETIYDTNNNIEISFVYNEANSVFDTLNVRQYFFLQNGNIDYVIYYAYPEQAIKLKIDSTKYYYDENSLITKENWLYNNIDEYWDLLFTENIYYDFENRIAQEWFCPAVASNPYTGGWDTTYINYIFQSDSLLVKDYYRDAGDDFELQNRFEYTYNEFGQILSFINWTGNSSPPYYNIYEYEYNDSFLHQVLHIKSIEPLDSIGSTPNSLLEIQKKVYSYDYIQTTNIDNGHFKTPTCFSVKPNFPNPFNPITTLRYDLSKDSYVKIAIYDMTGRQIKTLVNTYQSSGSKSVQWDATNNQGELVSAGVYLYKIQAGEFSQTKKMILLK